MHSATFVFILTYILICMGENSPRKLDRPTAALFGAVLMVLTGSLTRTEAAAAIDLSTISLLFGMMVLLAVLIQSRLPMGFALRVLKRCRSANALMGVVVLVSGIASALMLNDTVCLLGTPILLDVLIQAEIPTAPFLLALATSSNIGSVMALTGNPQNMIIGHLSHWSWSGFLLRMAPIGILCLLINWLALSLIFRHQLNGVNIDKLREISTKVGVRRKLAIRSLIMFTVFITAITMGSPMDFAAVASAILLLVWINRPPKLTFGMVDWSLLLFFTGLFIVVQGLLKADRTLLSHTLGALGTHTSLMNITKWSIATIVGSNIFSNVPFVLIAGHWVERMSDAKFFWLLLSLTSTLAGNLTLFGSVANVIVAQCAQEKAPLSFLDFLRVGVPITIITTAAGVLMLWGFHLIGWV